jgi:hypothetical protein
VVDRGASFPTRSSSCHGLLASGRALCAPALPGQASPSRAEPCLAKPRRRYRVATTRVPLDVVVRRRSSRLPPTRSLYPGRAQCVPVRFGRLPPAPGEPEAATLRFLTATLTGDERLDGGAARREVDRAAPSGGPSGASALARARTSRDATQAGTERRGASRGRDRSTLTRRADACVCRAAHWLEVQGRSVRPELVASVRYLEPTARGRLRMTAFPGIREDVARPR